VKWPSRYGRRFADHWEFVAYARSHDLKLDLTTPPIRHRAPWAGGLARHGRPAYDAVIPRR
jgi:hypothetical protein